MQTISHRIFLLGVILFGGLSLAGCTGIARGVTEAVLEKQENGEDTRQCEIEGPAFQGVRQSLDQHAASSSKVTKVLMVHGISNHLPGYSARFQKKLYDVLGLTLTDPTVKTIQLASKDIKGKNGDTQTLGTLRITRHSDADHRRELLFYELTWSPITAPQKQTLEEDSANNQGLIRADMNGSLKGFLNATVPDLLIYNGNGYQRITSSVTQSVCWMLANDWKALPEKGAHQCEEWPHSKFTNLVLDDHYFVTHSLGSRITIDTIQNFAGLNTDDRVEAGSRDIRKLVRDKEFTVFMMANQLPLLQMGRDVPEITGSYDDYCQEGGPKTKSRVMSKMNIIAFSDPNDILSYPVPMDFMATKIDSRICPSITNVSLNVAKEKNLFDTVSFANPLTAHSGYMDDSRVIDLIANGIGHSAISSLIADRCAWRETTKIKDRTGETRQISLDNAAQQLL